MIKTREEELKEGLKESLGEAVTSWTHNQQMEQYNNDAFVEEVFNLAVQFEEEMYQEHEQQRVWDNDEMEGL